MAVTGAPTNPILRDRQPGKWIGGGQRFYVQVTD
jgi:hypothetical protein